MPGGEVFFNDVPGSKTYKIGLDAKVSLFLADSKKGDGTDIRPRWPLYAVSDSGQKIVAYDAEGKATVIADGLRGNDLVVASNGNIYATNPGTAITIRARYGSSNRAVERKS